MAQERNSSSDPNDFFEVADDVPAREYLSGFDLSASAETVLRRAGELAEPHAAPMDGHAIFLGLLSYGREAPKHDSAWFLWNTLSGSKPQGVHDPFAWFDLPRPYRDPPKTDRSRGPSINRSGIRFIEQAARCSEATGGGRHLSLRHLVGTLLLGPNAFEIAHDAGLIGEKGTDLRTLASDYLTFLRENFPEDESKWRAWAGASDRVSSFSSADMESHVARALFAARSLAGARPVASVHVLRGIASLTTHHGSTAFMTLRKLVALITSSVTPASSGVETVSDRRQGTLDIELVSTLERQLSYAREWGTTGTTLHASSDKRRLWGRDLVTAALLAGGQDLERFLETFGTTLESLRRSWYGFVTSDSDGRSREEWDAWWQFAGVTLPRLSEETAEVPGALPNEAYAAPHTTTGWSEYPVPVKRAFSWALAAAGKMADAAVHVNLVEFVGGLLKEAELGVETWNPGLAWPKFEPILRLPHVDHVVMLDSHPTVSTAVEQIMEKAARLCSPTDPAFGTALFLALFQPDQSGGTAAIDRVLPQGVDADGMLGAFARKLRERSSSLVQTAGEILKLREGGWSSPYLDGDRVSGAISEDQDRLDVSRQALRFAKLLAAEKVKPPIALGLFGNWGSGKTFFMGLMRSHIDDLSNGGDDGYVRRIAHVEFNAWHYQDANLWASLAMRIFDELARELGGKVPEAVETKRKELHQKIQSSKARRLEAEQRQSDALKQRSLAAQELQRRQAKRRRLEEKSSRLRLKAAWLVVRRSCRFKKLRRAVSDTLSKQLGLSVALETVDDLERLRREIDGTSVQARSLFAILGHRFSGGSNATRTVMVLVLVALVVLATGVGLEWIAGKLRVELPEFSVLVVQIGAVISATAGWCGRRVREIHGALDLVGKVEADLATAEKDVSSTHELASLQNKLASLDKQIRQVGEELSAAEREIAEATVEIERINHGGLVYDFLQGRRTATTYLGQLGLISTIRRDLEELGGLLRDFAEHGANPIERIILYIDDLDRCHPDQVVEVLQAVHLLLAFDLFNVVVGVDARWLERALHEKYVGPGRRSRRLVAKEFSPQDYLEKIFQIPYVLAPMSEKGFKELIAGLVESRTEWREKRKQKVTVESKLEARDATGASDKNVDHPVAPDAPAKTADSASALAEPKAVGLRSSSEAIRAPEHVPALPAAEKLTSAPTRSVEPALFFEDCEEKFIQELHRFVNRPRLAKRLVNIYRLLRVRADDEGESPRFVRWVDDPSAEFRAALVLLAINVGHAKIGPRLLRTVELAAKDRPWLAFLDELAMGAGPGQPWPNAERQEIADIAKKLAPIGAQIPQTIEAYKLWAPRVGCYSFDWHRVG